MTTQLIPRPDALVKLLQLGPMHKYAIYDVTGWPMSEIESILDAQIKAGRIAHLNGNQVRHYRVPGDRKLAA